jgi:catechol 2,3-dioxygenase-like lactoylglutathione lyase family enzyme
MKTTLAHLQLNVAAENLPFYKDLLGFAGWRTIYEEEGMAGFDAGADGSPSLWFIGAANGSKNDYDGAGMNHIGLGAASQADVDAAVGYLRGKGVAALFETPRHRPEFAAGEGQTYYQVMFESPDRILFEVVYTGPKT